MLPILSIGDKQPVWRRVFDAVLEPLTPSIDDEIIEYLHRHRHDLPPAVETRARPTKRIRAGRDLAHWQIERQEVGQ